MTRGRKIALIIVGLLMVFLLVGALIVALVLMSLDSEPVVPQNSVLVLNVEGSLPDYTNADEFSARFHLLGDAIKRRPTDASLVRVMMPASGSGREEQATLAEFAGRLIPEIARRHGRSG